MQHIISTNLDELSGPFLIDGDLVYTTTGHILNAAGDLIEEGAFGFTAHDDEDTWEELADADLRAAGWKRTSDWTHAENGDLIASITRA